MPHVTLDSTVRPDYDEAPLTTFTHEHATSWMVAWPVKEMAIGDLVPGDGIFIDKDVWHAVQADGALCRMEREEARHQNYGNIVLGIVGGMLLTLIVAGIFSRIVTRFLK